MTNNKTIQGCCTNVVDHSTNTPRGEGECPTPLNSLRGKQSSPFIIERYWSMPNRWTFSIGVVSKIIAQELTPGVWIEPFPGQASLIHTQKAPADALDYLKTLNDNTADGILLDPPFSEYQSISKYNRRVSSRYMSKVKDECYRILKGRGKCISFGYNSSGLGKRMKTYRIVLLSHGGSRNDTIITCQGKGYDR